VSGHTGIARPRKAGSASRGVTLEGFQDALVAEVPVPLPSKLHMLVVQFVREGIGVTLSGARVLLHADVVVAPILCEAPGYVKWSYTTWLRRSVHGALVFALLNIVRDSSRTDIRSARGDYGPVIEEGAIAFRVRGQL